MGSRSVISVIRSVGRHIPLYVGICVPALLRPTLNEAALKSGAWVRKLLRIETARVRGVPAIPRRSPRTPPLPRSPPVHA